MFVGSVIASAVSNIPEGYLLCDGSSLSTSQYSDLFQAIGYTFGGSGSSFNLPDLREKFIRGVGQSHSLGQSEEDANQSHSHAILSLSGGSHGHNVNRYTGVSGDGFHPPLISGYETNSYGVANRPMILSESTSNHTHSGDTQSSGSSECRPKNLSLKYLIRYLPFEVSSSAGLTEEQSAMLILISDFIKANCKDNGDGTFDYSKFKSYTLNGETLWLSDELLRFVSKNYWQ